MSLDYGESILNPFKGSAVEKQDICKVYDFEYLPSDDEIELNDLASDDVPFDDMIDLSDPLDI